MSIDCFGSWSEAI